MITLAFSVEGAITKLSEDFKLIDDRDRVCRGNKGAAILGTGRAKIA